MLKMLKSKQFYVVTTIVLFAGFLIMMFINNQKNEVLQKASQLLVDNNVDISSLYEDKEDTEAFTKSAKATATEPSASTERTAIKNSGIASESNLRSVLDAFTLARYGFDKNSTIESIKTKVETVTTDKCYEKNFKDLIKEDVLMIPNTLETNTKVKEAYFSGLDTSSPKAYAVIDVSYTVDKVPYAYTVTGNFTFTYDKEKDTWLIDELNLTEK